MLTQIDDLVIDAGETFTRTYALPSGFVTTGAPTATAIILPSRDSDTPALTLTQVDGLTFDFVGLTLKLTISSARSLALLTSLAAYRRGRWTCKVVDGAGTTTPLVGGDVDIVQNSTH